METLKIQYTQPASIILAVGETCQNSPPSECALCSQQLMCRAKKQNHTEVERTQTEEERGHTEDERTHTEEERNHTYRSREWARVC